MLLTRAALTLIALHASARKVSRAERSELVYRARAEFRDRAFGAGRVRSPVSVPVLSTVKVESSKRREKEGERARAFDRNEGTKRDLSSSLKRRRSIELRAVRNLKG